MSFGRISHTHQRKHTLLNGISGIRNIQSRNFQYPISQIFEIIGILHILKKHLFLLIHMAEHAKEKIKIWVSTTSAIKVAALQSAMTDVFWQKREDRFTIKPTKVQAGEGQQWDRWVPEQPLGEEEIMTWIRKWNQALLDMWVFDVVLSIETWLVKIEDNEYVDRTWSALWTREDLLAYSWPSSDFTMPLVAVKKSLESGRTLTAASQVEWIVNLKDPYKFLSDGEVTREQKVKESLIWVLQQYKETLWK